MAGGFFEQLLGEAVGPLFTDHGTVLPPAGEDVALLDRTVSVADQLDLVAPDIADEVLDAFADRPISELAEFVDGVRVHFGVLVAPACGWAELVATIDRYGPAIEKDLALYMSGECLYAWVRDHEWQPWDRLLRLLDALPPGGHFSAARASDIELAERIAELEAEGHIDPPSSTPSLVGWTDQKAAYEEMNERLARIEHAIVAMSMKVKRPPRPPKPRARPRTARDRVDEVRMWREHDEIASQLLGDRYKPVLSTKGE